MKTFLKISALLTLGVALVNHAGAAFESIRFSPDNRAPQFPSSLQFEGITRGKAVIAISVGVDGRVADSLVLGYTHEQFARSCLETLQEWRFTPAKLDGVPVPATTELAFDFTLEGAVISSNIVNHFFYDNFEALGDGRFAYRLRRPDEIDQAPSLVGGSAPKYALAAEQDGVRGRVEVHFYIDETGAVRLPAVKPGAPGYLADSALAALRAWRFEPAKVGNRPVLVAASEVFDFSSMK